MAWYYILFFSVLAFFLIKTVLSWLFGETDIDFDADGDIDFDVSSMLSFKGLLHFLLGFSTYLAATARFDRTYDALGIYHFTFVHYLIAAGMGIAFMIMLWYLYQMMMKLNHGNQINIDLTGYSCSVLTNLNNGRYVVIVKTPIGVLQKTLEHVDNTMVDIPVGSELTIKKDAVTKKYVLE